MDTSFRCSKLYQLPQKHNLPRWRVSANRHFINCLQSRVFGKLRRRWVASESKFPGHRISGMFCSICADDGVVVVDDSFLRTNRAASRLTKQGASARDWACIDVRSGILAEFCRRSSDRFDSSQREFCHSGARIGATLLASFPGSQMNTSSRIFVSALSPFITLLVLTASSTASAQDARGTVMNESLHVYSDLSPNTNSVPPLPPATVI